MKKVLSLLATIQITAFVCFAAFGITVAPADVRAWGGGLKYSYRR